VPFSRLHGVSIVLMLAIHWVLATLTGWIWQLAIENERLVAIPDLTLNEARHLASLSSDSVRSPRHCVRAVASRPFNNLNVQAATDAVQVAVIMLMAVRYRHRDPLWGEIGRRLTPRRWPAELLLARRTKAIPQKSPGSRGCETEKGCCH